MLPRGSRPAKEGFLARLALASMDLPRGIGPTIFGPQRPRRPERCRFALLVVTHGSAQVRQPNLYRHGDGALSDAIQRQATPRFLSGIGTRRDGPGRNAVVSGEFSPSLPRSTTASAASSHRLRGNH